MAQAAEKFAYPIEVTEADLRVSPAARAKMAELLAEADAELQYIRVFVTGGGCGGMTYGMTFSDQTSEYDSVLVQDGVKLAVDAVALNYLRGCEIDFAHDAFIFNKVFQSVGGTGVCGGCGAARGGGGGCGA